MLSELKKLAARLGAAGDDESVAGDELQVATAALLVHAAAIDGQIAVAERTRLKSLLEQHFSLEPGEAEVLFGEAVGRERDAVDIYSFTRVLQAHLGQEQRQSIVELMWEVVAADDEIHPYESNLVWRAAELIGVSTRDRVTLRQRVLARHGIGTEDG